MNTRLTELLVSLPIIQTAMGWVADAKLVAATGEAGGLGSAGAVMTPAEIEQGIRNQSADECPVWCELSYVCAHAEQIVDLCIEHQVELSATHDHHRPQRSIN